jgi:glutamate synthase (NADPH/NADH) large chain
MVDLEDLDADDVTWLADILARHALETDSPVAAGLLDRWAASQAAFVKVMPRDFKRVLEAARRAEEDGTSVDEAIMAAAHG